MNSVPKASIIIPTYNQEKIVGQTIDSALAQTYPDFEVIVVDDGSLDQTVAVLESYGDRICYMQQENQGPAAARNTGFRASKGDYLIFLDGDDLIPANKLERQVSFLEAHLNFGLAYSAWQDIDDQDLHVLAERRPKKEGFLLEELLRRSLFFSPGAAVIRRQCVIDAGLFDQSLFFCSDMEILIQIAKAGYAFGYVDEILFQYRLVKSSMSSQIARQCKDEFFRHHKFFADPTLPESIQVIEADVTGILNYEFAAKYYNIGEIDKAQEHIREAIKSSSTLAANKDWLLDWITGFSLDVRVEDPYKLIHLIFDNLPEDATILRSLPRRKVFGRFHTASAFTAFHNHDFRGVRRHILPALLGDPSILLNRGFISISLRSLINI